MKNNHTGFDYSPVTKNKAISLLAVLLVLSVIVSSCAFTKRGEQRMYSRWAKNQIYDMIIVPGIEWHENDTLSWRDSIMKGRIYWAKFLYDKGIAKNIMFSGSAVYAPYYEAMIMAMYAEAMGVPKEHIFMELKAEHSIENLYYSYKKSKQLGFKTIALASDPFQTKQLRSFAHLRLSRDIGIIPLVEDSIRLIDMLKIPPKIDYRKAFKENFVSIRQRESRWKRIKGTMGLNRDKKAYE
jgi:uncharacterized SAM-binding protein YcdF (DUF218 family)